MRKLLVLLMIVLVAFSINFNSCINISSPGYYNLTGDLAGANISATPLPGYACIKISSSNVYLECNNHKISISGNNYGVLVLSPTLSKVTNVTLSNCEIEGTFSGVGYEGTGIMIYNSSLNSENLSMKILNVSVDISYSSSSFSSLNLSNFGIGILVENSNDLSFKDATGILNGTGTFSLIKESSNISFSNFYAKNLDYGFYIINSTDFYAENGTIENTRMVNTTRVGRGLKSFKLNSANLTNISFINASVYAVEMVNTSNISFEFCRFKDTRISLFMQNASVRITSTTEPITLPDEYIPFQTPRLIKIEKALPDAFIDRLRIYYESSDVTGFENETFTILRYNDTYWFNLTTSENKAERWIEAYNITNFSVFEAFAYAPYLIPWCRTIQKPGNYTVIRNLFRTRFQTTPLPGYACIRIKGSNITVNFNGYNMSSDQVGPTYGVLIMGENISFISNISALGPSQIFNYTYALYVINASNINLSNLKGEGNNYLVYLNSSTNVDVGNTKSSEETAFFSYNSSNIDLENFTSFNSTSFFVNNSKFLNISDGYVEDGSFRIYHSSNVKLFDVNAVHPDKRIEIVGLSNSTFTKLGIFNSSYSFLLRNSINISFDNLRLYNISLYVDALSIENSNKVNMFNSNLNLVRDLRFFRSSSFHLKNTTCLNSFRGIIVEQSQGGLLESFYMNNLSEYGISLASDDCTGCPFVKNILIKSGVVVNAGKGVYSEGSYSINASLLNISFENITNGNGAFLLLKNSNISNLTFLNINGGALSLRSVGGNLYVDDISIYNVTYGLRFSTEYGSGYLSNLAIEHCEEGINRFSVFGSGYDLILRNALIKDCHAGLSQVYGDNYVGERLMYNISLTNNTYDLLINTSSGSFRRLNIADSLFNSTNFVYINSSDPININFTNTTFFNITLSFLTHNQNFSMKKISKPLKPHPDFEDLNRTFFEITPFDNVMLTYFKVNTESIPSSYNKSFIFLLKSNSSDSRFYMVYNQTSNELLKESEVKPLVVNTSTVFGLFYMLKPIYRCMDITSGGEYYVLYDKFSPSLPSPLGGLTCIRILSSNVSLDINFKSALQDTGGSTHYITVINSTNVSIRNAFNTSNYTYYVSALNSSVEEHNFDVAQANTLFNLFNSSLNGFNNKFTNSSTVAVVSINSVFNFSGYVNNTNIHILSSTGGFRLKQASKPGVEPPLYSPLAEGKYIELVKDDANAKINELTFYWLDNETIGSNESLIDILRFDGSSWYNVSNQERNESLNYITAYNITNFSVFGPHIYGRCIIDRCMVVDNSCHYWKVIKNLGGTTLSDGNYSDAICLRVVDSDITIDFNHLNMSNSNAGIAILIRDNATGEELRNITILNLDRIQGYHRGIVTYNVSNLNLINGTIYNTQYSVEVHHSRNIYLDNFRLWRHSPAPSTYYSTYFYHANNITFANVSFYSDGSNEWKELRFIFADHSSNIFVSNETSFDSRAPGYLDEKNIFLENSQNITFNGTKFIDFAPYPYALIQNSYNISIFHLNYSSNFGASASLSNFGLFKFVNSHNITVENNTLRHPITFVNSSNIVFLNNVNYNTGGFRFFSNSRHARIERSRFLDVNTYPEGFTNYIYYSHNITIFNNSFVKDPSSSSVGIGIKIRGSSNISIHSNFFGNSSSRYLSITPIYICLSNDVSLFNNTFRYIKVQQHIPLVLITDNSFNNSICDNLFIDNQFVVSSTPWTTYDYAWGRTIQVEDSSNNKLINNTFIYSLKGDLSPGGGGFYKSGSGEIVLIDAGYNLITNNFFELRTRANFMRAIHLIRSENVTIENNTMINESIFILGDKSSHFSSFIIKNNTVNGKPVLYVKNEVGGKYQPLSNYGEIIIVNSKNIILENMSIKEPITSALIVAFTNDSLFKNINLSSYRLISLYASNNNNVTFRNVSIEGDWQGWNAVRLLKNKRVKLDELELTHVGRASSLELIRNNNTIINKLRLFNNSMGAPWDVYGIYMRYNYNTTINNSLFRDGWDRYIGMRNNNVTVVNNSKFYTLSNVWRFAPYIWLNPSESNWNYNTLISYNYFDVKGNSIVVRVGPNINLTISHNLFNSNLRNPQIQISSYFSSWPKNIYILHNTFNQTGNLNPAYVISIGGISNLNVKNNSFKFVHGDSGLINANNIVGLTFANNSGLINVSSGGIKGPGFISFYRLRGGKFENNVFTSHLTSPVNGWTPFNPILVLSNSHDISIANLTLKFKSITGLTSFQENSFVGLSYVSSYNSSIRGLTLFNLSKGIKLDNSYEIKGSDIKFIDLIGKGVGFELVNNARDSIFSNISVLNASIAYSSDTTSNITLSSLIANKIVYGAYISNSRDTKLSNITIINASKEGIRLDSNTFGTNVKGFNITDSRIGVRVINSQSLSYTTYLMNGLIRAEDTGILFDDIDEKLFVWNVTVVNQTLCINSTGANTGALWINFSSNITVYPHDYTPINMHRFINISKLHPSTVMDELMLYYNDVEDIPFNEEDVRILYFNGSHWKLPLNQTVNTSENYVKAPQVNGSGKFGLFVPGHPVFECKLANETGTYLQIDELEGAVYPSDPVDPASFACVELRVGNIYFNANNKTINSTFVTNFHYAVFGADEWGGWLNNITIANYSNITGYKGGIYLYKVHNSSIYSSTLYNNTYAVYVFGDNVKLENIKADLSTTGVEVSAEKLNTKNVEVHNSQLGFKAHVDNGNINSSYFSNNAIDLKLLGSNSTVSIEKSLFTLTNVSILFENLSNVTVNSSNKPAPLPPYITKEFGKWINITKNDNSTRMKYLRIYFSLSDLNGTSESNLTIVKWHNGTWQLLNTTVNTTAHYAEVRNITNFSVFGLVALGDAYPPAVHLISPPDGYSTTQTTLTLSFIAEDDADTMLDCELYLDNSLEFSGSVPNNTVYNVSVSPGTGLHYWNVTCVDDAGNRGYSETWQFSIYEEESKKKLELDADVSCDNITVFVNVNDKPVRYADVKVYLENETLEFETGSDGTIVFVAYDGEARIVAEKTGYRRADITIGLPSYEECYPEPKPKPKPKPPAPEPEIKPEPHVEEEVPVLYLKLCEEACNKELRQINALVIVNAALRKGAVIKVMPLNITCLTNNLGRCYIYINTTKDMLINVSAFDPETGLSTTRQFFVHGCYVKARVESQERAENAYIEVLSITNVLLALLILVILAELYVYYKQNKEKKS